MPTSTKDYYGALGVKKTASPEDIRRDRHYLDTVEEIWRGLRQYVD